MNVASLAFHDTMHRLEPYRSGDRLHVVNSLPRLYVAPTLIERLKELFYAIITCSCLRKFREASNQEERVKESIIRLVNENAPHATKEDLAGLTACKNYLRLLPQMSADVKECLQTIETIRQRVLQIPRPQSPALSESLQRSLVIGQSGGSQVLLAEIRDREMIEGKFDKAAEEILKMQSEIPVYEFGKFIYSLIGLSVSDPKALNRLEKLFEKIGKDVTRLALRMSDRDPASVEIPPDVLQKAISIILPCCSNLASFYTDDLFLVSAKPKFNNPISITFATQSDKTREALHVLKAAPHLDQLTVIMHSGADYSSLREISGLTGLTTLKLCNTRQDESSPVPLLKPLKRLSNLEIMGYLVGQDDLAAFEDTPKLTTLSINRITDQRILEQIGKISSLNKLTVIAKSITYSTFLDLVPHLPELQTLSLEADVGESKLDLAQFFKNYPLLSNLSVANVKVASQGDVEAVASAVKAHQKLEKLSIGVAAKGIALSLKELLPNVKVETNVKM